MGLDHSRAFDADWSDDDLLSRHLSKRNRERRGRPPRRAPEPDRRADPARRRRADGQETFRCRHCRTVVGPTVSGGRHRNHCPLCLYSLHVDGKTPGDRASDCRSLMAPVGLFLRATGEQVIVHRCLGCGFERHNRVAADDSVVAVMRLPLVAPRLSGALPDEEATTA